MSTASTGASTLRLVTAWALVLLLLGLLTKTAMGYKLVYYMAALGIVFVLVTQYKKVGSLLAPIEATG